MSYQHRSDEHIDGRAGSSRAEHTPAGSEKQAASSEASAMLSPYSFTKYCGIQTDRAVKPPKTIE
jgi:hypothetical protein